MKTLTWANFAEHKPCYNPAEKYGEWEGTILDLMQHLNIPDEDKIWAFTREGITDDKTLRLFAVACAKRVQHLLKDQRSNAIDVAERYANGNATENMSAVARYAVRSADLAVASDVEGYAASDVASDAERYAARVAARAAARAAASDAERYAARVAASDAEKQAQVEIAIELLTKLK